MFKKKGLLGYKGFKQQTFLLILMERLKISFKGKNKFARNETSSYLPTGKGAVLRQIE
jgi:hypothetical protein